MEIFWTIFIGITVFVFSQIFLKLVIEPIYQLEKTMANVFNIFIYHAVALHNSDLFTKDLKGKELFNRLEVKKLLERLRALSAQLHEDIAFMPKRLYKSECFRNFFELPEEKKFTKVHKI
jgi:hypothetical protein